MPLSRSGSGGEEKNCQTLLGLEAGGTLPCFKDPTIGSCHPVNDLIFHVFKVLYGKTCRSRDMFLVWTNALP
jgi:hypothetical protein